MCNEGDDEAHTECPRKPLKDGERRRDPFAEFELLDVDARELRGARQIRLRPSPSPTQMLNLDVESLSSPSFNALWATRARDLDARSRS